MKRGINTEKLLEMAAAVKKNAYAPYTGYTVGAALVAGSGKYYAGCNLENAALTPTIHAEAAAMAAAAGAGEREIIALAVVTDAHPPQFPCALCRQSLAEFSPAEGEMLILTANPDGEVSQSTLAALYPEMFGPGKMGIDPRDY